MSDGWRSYLPRRFRNFLRRRPRVTIIRLSGVIGAVGPMRSGLCLRELEPVLERAFEYSRLSAVALVINSPGGSPVQSALIAERIRQLAEEHEVPVLAFVEDVAASGGYWLACAADEIFADENSVIGSIGVISASFGFHDFISRHGIERRIHTAGECKAMLDPFRPEDAGDVERLKALQAEIHGNFADMVRRRRGDRLPSASEALFTGEFWLGKRALGLGLIDGLEDMYSHLRKRFGERVRLIPIDEERGWIARHIGLAHSAPAALAPAAVGAVISAVEQRALWARYGL
ncbi:MAG: S49 family peptidase [Rhodospirillaceae bacterium]